MPEQPKPWQPDWKPGAEPTRVGANAIGPAGWVAVAGIVINAVVYVLHASAALLPPPWSGIVMGIVSVLTVLGVYHAPNHVLPAADPKAKRPG